MKGFALLLACLLLSGCMGRSPEQRFAEAQDACQNYGFKPGTEPYAQCMMRLDLVMQEQDYSRRQAIAQDLQDWAARNRTTTCNTSAQVYGGLGNSAYGNSTTTCY